MDGAVLPVWGLWLGAQLARLSAAGAYTASVGDGGATDGARSGSGGGLSVTIDSVAEGCELSVGSSAGLSTTGASSLVEQRA